MHFAFIPYGKRSEVELLLRDMEAQKHLLVMRKGEEEKKIWMQGQVRLCPLGVIEYIFPRENIDVVLHTLIDNKNRYELPKLILSLIKRLLKLQKIPEYKKDANYLWVKDNVNIIPLGIREDAEITGTLELDNGWVHESI